MNKNRVKILLGRFDLDGHDRGILSVIDACKNAGIEVVYVHFSNPREIVKSAIEEDVDLIGITSSLGQHEMVSSILIEELGSQKMEIPVIMGGVIPNMDIPGLMAMGVSRVFAPGSSPGEAVSFILQSARSK